MCVKREDIHVFLVLILSGNGNGELPTLLEIRPCLGILGVPDLGTYHVLTSANVNLNIFYKAK